jgi:circadian clock protein KaiB
LLKTLSRPACLDVPATLLAPRTHVSELRLKLFIAGNSPRARAAASDLARVCHEHLDGEAIIETVDVLLEPELADAYCVLTTPTVVREFPLPRRRATGDLNDAAQLLAALALHSTHVR